MREGKCKKMELAKGEKNFLKNVVEDLRELGKFSIKYKEIYEFEDENLSLVCSSFQNWLNNIFTYMNSQLQARYFHANDSRDFMELNEKIEEFVSNLYKQKIALRKEYSDKIAEINTFISKYNGTNVPESFLKIDIIKTEPVFYFEETIVKKDKKIKLEIIGEGAYAKVYKYYDEDYEEWFAMKKLKGEDSKEIERFRSEFSTMKKLNSPFVVKVYKYLASQNKYIMEYLDTTLFDYIQKTKPNMEKIKQIIRQILGCFLYLSQNDILHRDISPYNILIKKYDSNVLIKVSDFGLVKTEESFLTSTNTDIKGSLNDPQLRVIGFKNYEIRHETYALSQLITFLLTGKRNFSNIKNKKIKAFIEKGMSDLENRFQNMEEFSTEVKKLLRELN